jgi:glycosyltransferase involved in cell wall biosynthesis
MWPNEADPSYGCFVQDQMESLRPFGVEYDVLFINGRDSRWNYCRAISEVRRRLRQGAYDLVHAHFGLSGCVARFQFKRPLVVTFHGDDVLGQPRRDGSITPMGRLFQVTSLLLAPLATAVIVQNREMKRRLRLNSVEVIPCGVDLELFQQTDQQEARRALGLAPDAKYVLFPYDPGVQRKRFDLIDAAVKLAMREIPRLQILHVKGKPHSQMPLYLNAADAVVLASLIEGSPMVTKEAMAVGLPVISVDVGDATDLIFENDGNFLVERDADSIARRIITVCQSGRRSSARERVASLSMEAVAKRILKVYERSIRS